MRHTLLNWLGPLDAIRWERVSLDSASVCAKRGGEATGPSPTDRGTRGSTYHLVVDQQGVPLAVLLSAANVHESKLLEPLVDVIPPIWRPANDRDERHAASLLAFLHLAYALICLRFLRCAEAVWNDL